MNQNRKEELLTRWMDDALRDDELREIDPLLAEHPELQREREEYGKIREELKAAFAGEVEPPYPDFFNSHLERHIEGLARLNEEDGRKRKSGLGRLWTWWLAPAAAAAIVAAFIAGMNSAPSPGAPVIGAVGSDVYSPLESVTTEVVRDEALGGTLLVVDGLEDLSDDDLALGGSSGGGGHGFFVTTAAIY